MQRIRIALCALGAMVGAGIASGREIMQFFSRHGRLSWILLIWTGAAVTALLKRVMDAGRVKSLLPGGRSKVLGEGLWALLLMGTGGAMAAAAGELSALTIPLPYARGGGMILTLTGCLLLRCRSCAALARLSGLLLPGMGAAFLLCLSVPGQGMAENNDSWQGVTAFLQTPCYAGMNVMMAAGVLWDAGRECSERERKQGVILAGTLITAVLALGNAALLPHGEVRQAALPVVALLRVYGKGGYYLSAVLLYLAVVTTLLASLQTMTALLSKKIPRYGGAVSALGIALMAQLGFDQIIATIYPALGCLCFALLIWPRKNAGD